MRTSMKSVKEVLTLHTIPRKQEDILMHHVNAIKSRVLSFHWNNSRFISLPSQSWTVSKQKLFNHRKVIRSSETFAFLEENSRQLVSHLFDENTTKENMNSSLYPAGPTASGSDGSPPLDRPPLLVLRSLSDAWSSALSAKFTIIPPSSPLSTSTRAVLIYGSLNPVDSTLLDQYPSLRCVVTTSVGVNHIDLEECRRRGVLVANVGETFSKDVADYAVGLLIDALRRITMSDRYLRNGLWVTRGDYPLGSKLGGKRVGIVGLGSIGSAIAKRLMAFDCKISYFSRKPKQTANYRYIANVIDLATESDILVVSCSLTKETHHIINKQVLQALGKEGIIINIGRGAHIDEPELVRSLVQGEIKGAGLDVYENEPNVPKEIFEMENVVLTPHQAAFTPAAFSDVIQICIANFEAFFAGKPLLTQVVAG